MAITATSLNRLIDELTTLPGIGKKTAQRLSFYILKMEKSKVENLIQAIADVKQKITTCSKCGSITEEDPCPICSDVHRNQQLVCVVEQSSDVFALEKAAEYQGVYHVLNGALSPMDGITPDDLNIQRLLTRISEDNIEEIIIATNPNVEGEATSSYLTKLLKPLGVKVTRIARGLPVGGDLEYIDEITLMKAIEGRQEL